ncbi:uncharacterized protein LOC131335853 [Rhododendron vialii]|uniref:uncharacterized protein LOC131335853 n=1 Tax=Rhododendron vialii TaxID=182163 RepID=UPI00265DB832|nr:uncharacterized protein LOC131335853 [Rhododendron vialii]XP_058227375.1 uncharacterized protein LOC131335853 [Rhododendron vialii]XP_058227376.1 uncharacterized protein LOC131335853 [Rhododendron vialii]
MINGEATGEASVEVALPDPPNEESDGGDESPVYSQYSSCGESEFERYCSANSVLGTSSLCSSVGDVGSLGDFSLGAGFSRRIGDKKLLSPSGSGCLSDHRIGPWEGNNLPDVENGVEGRGLGGVSDGLNSDRNMGDESDSELPEVVDLNSVLDEELCMDDGGGGVFHWRDHSESEVMRSSGGTLADQHTSSIESIEENASLGLGVNIDGHSSDRVEVETHQQVITEQVNISLDQLYSDSAVEFDVREVERCSDEDDNDSSRFEHSEGEDSMFGYGSDDEQKINLLHKRNMQYHEEGKVEKGNSLLMGSSIAFGSNDWDDFELESSKSDIKSMMLEKIEPNTETEINALSSVSRTETGFSGIDPDKEALTYVSVPTSQVQSARELEGCIKNGSLTPIHFLDFCDTEQGNDAEDVLIPNNQVGDLDESVDWLKTGSGIDILQTQQDILSQDAPLKEGSNFRGGNLEKAIPLLSTQKFDKGNGSQVLEIHESEQSTSHLDPLFDIRASQLASASTETPDDQRVGFPRESLAPLGMDENDIKRQLNDSYALFNRFEVRPKPVKTENQELNEFYDEFVHEMEEILLDSTESPGARFTHDDKVNRSHLSLPLRDGGSTASTSGNDDAYSLILLPMTINGVEVVGAKQKKGDVSFGERLVGVKEYTVYTIRVWSGTDHWEVERRYRDFCTLYRRLKTVYENQGWILPSPWAAVERESRKIFGNVSPDVVSERSALIQECLRSILHSRLSSSFPSALIWFFAPPKVVPSSPASNTFNPASPFSARGRNTDNMVTLGKTISLIVEIRLHKSTKQILEAQHYTCAGCHKHFDDGKTRMLEFVQTLGWGKPRLCEYTGQLFCSVCHTNETAVLPARVLHHWDFTHYPVSQLAKSYLDSIHDQPMLCVSAVNPILFSKVPALVQVTGVRKRIGAMLPFVRCPFRMSIYKGLASRRYLLESNEFFALRDLIDLSKGVFSVLPVMVDTISRKILEHITEQCLVCCDVGVPCNARQACDDPSSLIFPFQEGEVERCRSCKSVFHNCCFKKITSCPCGHRLKEDLEKGGSTSSSHRIGNESSSTLDMFGRKSDSKSTVGFLSGLFTKAKQEKLWGPKDSDTVILMGSLPSTSV